MPLTTIKIKDLGTGESCEYIVGLCDTCNEIHIATEGVDFRFACNLNPDEADQIALALAQASHEARRRMGKVKTQ